MLRYQARTLRGELLKRGQSCASIARRLGVHRATVSRVVAGLMRSRPIEQAIAHIVGVPITDLWPAVRRKPWAERTPRTTQPRRGTPKRAA